LAEHWPSLPKVVGSLPTVAGHILQARPVWIYTQSNITNNEFYSVRAIFFSVLVLCTQVNMFVMLL
jgi:hypothetical protein